MSASRKQASDITNRAGFFLRQLARRDGDGGPSSTVVGVIIVGVVIGFVALLVGIYVKHADRSRGICAAGTLYAMVFGRAAGYRLSSSMMWWTVGGASL
ncbi:hypothetical protein ACCO45_008892 [Purpureocillium lilacinum]|uniref:Uncharacterized protein n=1 Tax=Purpureocillium lilacinum TaxID=33203 RepID=A0ACC4DIG8_PURLI